MEVKKIKTNPFNSFSTNLRYERKKRHFTMEYLAEITDLSISYIGLLERKDKTPSLETLVKLCNVFNLTPDDLLLPKDQQELDKVLKKKQPRNK